MKSKVMKKSYLFLIFLVLSVFAFAQQVGIVRQNYYSSYYDSTLMTVVEEFDSTTIRLGSINPYTGLVSNLGNQELTLSINLNGATINPYLNTYYIGSGNRLLTFDISTGQLVNNVSITGIFGAAAFQNYRFNPSDSAIYGLVPNNFYSTYFDSTLMSTLEVLDSTQIRFASINPLNGVYSIIGNTSFDNMYTLAGNSIDPHQMIYYYSAVDTLIGIDLYTGAQYSAVPIQLPPSAIFENFAYSCVDSTIYGVTRQNYSSIYFDSLYMMEIEQIDSTTFRLSKINPVTGEVTIISPSNIGAGGNLTGGSFIDPNTMTYFLSDGNLVVGVSLITGEITSSVDKTFESNAISFDMMRSAMNCLGAASVRQNASVQLPEYFSSESGVVLFPNPVQNEISIAINEEIVEVEFTQLNGKQTYKGSMTKIDVSELPQGVYLVKIQTKSGLFYTKRMVKL
jgi:hypothetical protein